MQRGGRSWGGWGEGASCPEAADIRRLARLPLGRASVLGLDSLVHYLPIVACGASEALCLQSSSTQSLHAALRRIYSTAPVGAVHQTPSAVLRDGAALLQHALGCCSACLGSPHSPLLVKALSGRPRQQPHSCEWGFAAHQPGRHNGGRRQRRSAGASRTVEGAPALAAHSQSAGHQCATRLGAQTGGGGHQDGRADCDARWQVTRRCERASVPACEGSLPDIFYYVFYTLDGSRRVETGSGEKGRGQRARAAAPCTF